MQMMTDAESDDQATQPPTYRPERFDAPCHDKIETEEDLIAWAKAYARLCIDHYNIDIDESHLSWKVTRGGKRQAAAIRNLNLSKAVGVQYKSGQTSPDWDAVREITYPLEEDGFEDVKDVQIRIGWHAFQKRERENSLETIRHELIHVWEFQQFGATSHGPQFEKWARKMDVTKNAEHFSEYRYPFACSECGQLAGGRYRRSKAVEFAALSPEEQEEWINDGNAFWKSPCCDAHITLEND